jgi:hypothetical protein
MSAERRLKAAEAFWQDPNGASEQGEAIATIALRLKFRPRSVLTLPVERKSKYLVGMPAVSGLVAAQLLVAYHIACQRPMMAAFLDHLGIAHDDGLIEDEQVTPTGDEKLRAAATALAAAFPADDVALYLSTLTWQDPDAWGALADVPESRVTAGR